MDIPWKQIQPDTLRRLIESFVTREGTDYGQKDYSLDEKVEQVLGQIKRGEAKITYDSDTESCNIIST
jgi:uncharacterized protein YheU (UPF0270 family)